MNAYIMPNGTISLTDINFNQAKLIQTAIRRYLHIENKLNPLDNYDNNKVLALIDDVCTNHGKHTAKLKA